MSPPTIVIIGAGIAGLTAALALAQKGFSVDIIEQAEALQPVGAGLQLSPNATVILERLGLLPSLVPHWNEPQRIGLMNGATLSGIASVPVGDFARQRWQAPYAVLLRSTLQTALLDAVTKNPLCHLHFGQAVNRSDAPDLEIITGRRPDLIMGADGVWSQQRKEIAGAAPARFTGRLAWRSLVPFEAAPTFLKQDQVTAYLGPRTHLVIYPLKDAGAFNLVAITEGKEQPKSFGASVKDTEQRTLVEAFSAWHKDIRTLLFSGSEPLCWPLFEMADGPWQNGRDRVLIGDAAHAMTPFAAQGACMAIEDGSILAHLLSTHSVPDAIRAFETQRRPRIRRVRQRAAFNRFAYHAKGPVRFVRDRILSRRTPESLAADFDWLYGFKAD